MFNIYQSITFELSCEDGNGYVPQQLQEKKISLYF